MDLASKVQSSTVRQSACQTSDIVRRSSHCTCVSIARAMSRTNRVFLNVPLSVESSTNKNYTVYARSSGIWRLQGNGASLFFTLVVVRVLGGVTRSMYSVRSVILGCPALYTTVDSPLLFATTLFNSKTFFCHDFETRSCGKLRYGAEHT